MEFAYWVKDRFFCSPSITSLVIYSIYYIYICVGSLLIPAKIVDGHPSPKRGPRLKYSINGFKLTCLTLILLILFGGVIPNLSQIRLFRLAILADEFWSLWSVVNICALIISTLLYIKGLQGRQILGEYVDKHSHGSFALDFWVGKELNPRIGEFDIKFVAYRVGMLFWIVLNLGFLAKQIEVEGTTTFRMLCYQFTTAFYVLDYFWNEEKMLTTWDIISEEFGYMLVFGDYVFIPFAFSVQCHYLLYYPDFHSVSLPIAILLIFFIGYYVFRTANSQKNQYKNNPNQPIWGKPPKTIGGKLLVSGFWGIGRHTNYTGDIVMALADCLPCGTQIGGYFYVIYLFILLTHRAYRDDTKCKRKYNLLWKEYCQTVDYVYLPFRPIDSFMSGFGKALYSITNKDDFEEKND